MKRLTLAVFAFLLLLPVRADAQQCYGVLSAPPGSVCGTIAKPGWKDPGMSFNVAFCRPGERPDSPYNTCKTTTSYGTTDAWGRNVEAYVIYGWGGTSTYEPWNVFIWNDRWYWGHPKVPLATTYRNNEGVTNLSYVVPPRPVPPTPLYPPNGATNVPNSYTVEWNSGLTDAERQSYPTTWEIWFKHWLPGEPEPAQYSLARGGMPCHDDGSGPDIWYRCSTYVAGPQPAGYWRWKVVAKMDVTRATSSYSQIIFPTESSPAFFVGQ